MNIRKTGINKKIISSYDFKLKFGTAVTDPIKFEIFKYLAEQTYIVDGSGRFGFFDLQDNSLRNEFTKQKSFIIELSKRFLNQPLPHLVFGQTATITSDLINEFVEKELSPRIQDFMCLPYIQEKVVKFRNSYFLNTYVDDSLTYNEKFVDEKLLKEGLNLYACSLTNVTTELPDDLFTSSTEKWKNTQFYPFLYLIHWFAAIYQRPGIKHHTTIALVGPNEGIGKGSFLECCKRIIGHTAVGDLSAGQIDPQGFNNDVLGKQVLILNEMDTQNPDTLSSFVKVYGTDEEINVRAKYKNEAKIINISNIVITNNKFEILKGFHGGSRRLSLINTFSSDLHKNTTYKDIFDKCKGFAKANLTDDEDWKFIHSLCKLFSEIEVDYKMINVALESEEKELISGKKMNIFERWIRSNLIFFKKIGVDKQVSFKKCFENFTRWQVIHNYHSVDFATFQQEMKNIRLHNQGWFGPKGNQGLVIKQSLLDLYVLEEENEEFPDDNSPAQNQYRNLKMEKNNV